MYSKDYELRYSDMDTSCNIKKSAVIDLLQDVSINHANSVGLDHDKFESVCVACLLANWRIKFLKPLIPFECVTVKTGIMKITKCETYRKYEIWQNGECKVVATALWFMVNTQTMRISRMTEELFSVFECVTEEDNNLPCDKLRPEENAEFIGSTTVEKRDLDSNNHMNNVKSVEVALNRVPQDYDFCEIQVKYRKELKEGEAISVYGKDIENGLYREIRNANGDVCVLIYTND